MLLTSGSGTGVGEGVGLGVLVGVAVARLGSLMKVSWATRGVPALPPPLIPL